MHAYLRLVTVIMALNSTTAFAESTDNIPMVSDIEMKAQQQEAMAQIEHQIKSQLPSNMAKHYQLIKQYLPDNTIKETVKKHSNKGKGTRS